MILGSVTKFCKFNFVFLMRIIMCMKLIANNVLCIYHDPLAKFNP